MVVAEVGPLGDLGQALIFVVAFVVGFSLIMHFGFRYFLRRHNKPQNRDD